MMRRAVCKFTKGGADAAVRYRKEGKSSSPELLFNLPSVSRPQESLADKLRFTLVGHS